MPADMFGLDAHPDQAAGQIVEAWKVGDDPKDQRRVDRAGVLENAIQNPVGEDLDGLGPSNRFLPILLHPFQVMLCERIGA